MSKKANFDLLAIRENHEEEITEIFGTKGEHFTSPTKGIADISWVVVDDAENVLKVDLEYIYSSGRDIFYMVSISGPKKLIEDFLEGLGFTTVLSDEK